MKNNKGITMIEVIVVIALLFIILPFSWDYINSSLEDNSTLNNKMMVQNSVNSLMNQLQRDIQEARCPINPNVTNYIDVKEDGFLICKPNGLDEGNHIVYQNVLYKFNESENKVVAEFGLELDGYRPDYGIIRAGSTIGEYNYIKDISLDRVGDNGIKVYIRGEIDEKSGYTMTNTYYTRNTIF